MTYENIVYYKCDCNNNIHSLTFGQQKTKTLDITKVDNFKCPMCNKMTIQNKELLTIKDNTIIKKENI